MIAKDITTPEGIPTRSAIESKKTSKTDIDIIYHKFNIYQRFLLLVYQQQIQSTAQV